MPIVLIVSFDGAIDLSLLLWFSLFRFLLAYTSSAHVANKLHIRLDQMTVAHLMQAAAAGQSTCKSKNLFIFIRLRHFYTNK